MPQRRSTFWMPFSEGAAMFSLTSGLNSRLLIPSIRESEVGREYEGFTITRTILNLRMTLASGTDIVVTAGIIMENEDIDVDDVEPVDNPSADWIWHEEFIVPSASESLEIHRDIGSMRKARGGEQSIFFYLHNRTATTVLVHRSGRMLIKRA